MKPVDSAVCACMARAGSDIQYSATLPSAFTASLTSLAGDGGASPDSSGFM